MESRASIDFIRAQFNIQGSSVSNPEGRETGQRGREGVEYNWGKVLGARANCKRNES